MTAAAPWFADRPPASHEDALVAVGIDRWWEVGFRPASGAPRRLEDDGALLLTDAGARALRALGCATDVDVLVLLMREARSVDAIARWLRAHGAAEAGATGPCLAEAAWLLARDANALVSVEVYSLED